MILESSHVFWLQGVNRVHPSPPDRFRSPVLTRNPQFLGGYVRGPIVRGPLVPILIALGALLVVGDNALELLQG